MRIGFVPGIRTMTLSKASSAAALLDWYRAMGVDEAIGDAGIDRFAEAAAARTKTDPAPPPAEARQSSPPATPRREFASLAPDEAVMDARERARGANTLEELQEALSGFEGCPLKATAKNTCFKRGSDKARVMFIGEGPGRDEDLQGLPFVGRAGKLLDKMLTAISLTEDDVYITNIVYWRPPGNRTPTLQEVQACMPFLETAGGTARPGLPGADRRTRIAESARHERTASCGCAASGATARSAAGRARHCRCCTRPICCGTRPQNARRGATC